MDEGAILVEREDVNPTFRELDVFVVDVESRLIRLSRQPDEGLVTDEYCRSENVESVGGFSYRASDADLLFGHDARSQLPDLPKCDIVYCELIEHALPVVDIDRTKPRYGFPSRTRKEDLGCLPGSHKPGMPAEIEGYVDDVPVTNALDVGTSL